MRRSWIHHLYLVIIAALLLNLTACNIEKSDKFSGSGTKEEKNIDATDEQDKSSHQAISLNVMTLSNPPLDTALNNIRERFQKKYPEITVNFLAIASENQYFPELGPKLSSGNIDAFLYKSFSNPVSSWAKGSQKLEWQKMIENGVFEDLTSQSFLSRYDSDAVSASCSFEGKTFAIPTGRTGLNCIYYNKDQFEALGLTAPKTWEEFVTLCTTLQKMRITPMTCAGKVDWPYKMLGQGVFATVDQDAGDFIKKLWTGERKLNDPISMEIWKRNYQFTSFMDKNFLNTYIKDAINAFQQGKVAMFPSGTWDANSILTKNPDFKLGVFLLPGDNKNELQPLVGKYDYIWAAYAKSQNKDAAIKWLSFLSEKENYSEMTNRMGVLPCQPDADLTSPVAKIFEPYLKKFVLNYEYYIVSPPTADNHLIKGIFTPNNLVVAGGTYESYIDLANEAHKSWEKALADNQ